MTYLFILSLGTKSNSLLRKIQIPHQIDETLDESL